jgi:hypothetical protein
MATFQMLVVARFGFGLVEGNKMPGANLNLPITRIYRQLTS